VYKNIFGIINAKLYRTNKMRTLFFVNFFLYAKTITYIYSNLQRTPLNDVTTNPNYYNEYNNDKNEENITLKLIHQFYIFVIVKN
jgi:hypothetical protein